MALAIGIFVADPAALSASDSTLKTLLEADGHTVTAIDDDSLPSLATLIATYDVCIEGLSVSFAKLSTLLVDFTGGVIFHSGSRSVTYGLSTTGTNEAGCDELDVLLANHSAMGAIGSGTVAIRTSTTTWGTVVAADFGPGVLKLAEAEATTEIAVAILEKHGEGASSTYVVGRRVFAGCYNNVSTGLNTAGENLYGTLANWAGRQNPTPTIVNKTVGPTGDYATIQAAIDACVARVNLATVASGGERWVVTTQASVTGFDEQVLLTDGDLYTDQDCYLDFDGGGKTLDCSSDITPGDDVMHWGAPWTKVRNLVITYSGTEDVSGGSSSGCKSNSAGVMYDRMHARDIRLGTNCVGLSLNNVRGARIINCTAERINAGSEAFSQACGIKCDPAGSHEDPALIAGCTVSDIGNDGVTTEGLGIRADVSGTNSRGEEVHVLSNIATLCKTARFKYNINVAGGVIVTDANVSDDATADDNGDGTHLISQTATDLLVNPEEPSSDLHLKAGSNAIGFGLDLTATYGTAELAHDADGVTRSSFDAGAFEFVTTGHGPLLAGRRNSLLAV